ncbi:unnamed protein product [Diamesa serratosioi]
MFPAQDVFSSAMNYDSNINPVAVRVQYLLEANVTINNNADDQHNQPIDTETTEQYVVHTANEQLRNCIIIENNKPYKRKTMAQNGALKAPTVIVGALAGIQVGTMLYNDIHRETWTVGVEEQSIRLAIIIFYIAIVFGLIWAQGMISRSFSFQNIYTIMTICGIGIAALFGSGEGAIFSNYINKISVGAAFGVGYISILVHASEISDYYYRGRLLSLQHILFFAGVMISGLVPFTADTNSIFSGPEFCLGLLQFFCLMWSIFGSFWVLSSPVSKIRKDPLLILDNATDLFLELRMFKYTDILPKEAVEEFQELRLLVAEENLTSSNILKDNNLCILFIILLQRFGFFLTFNYALNQIFIGILEDSTFSYDFKLIFIGIRCISLCITMYIIDRNRKLHAYLPMGLSGILLLVIALFLLSVNSSKLTVILIIIFQFVCGLGVGVSSDVYTSEAFDTKKKPMSITLLVTIDCLFHILTVIATFNVKLSSGVQIMIIGGSGIGLIAIALYMLIFLPDTTRLTLRAAKNIFKNKTNVISYTNQVSLNDGNTQRAEETVNRLQVYLVEAGLDEVSSTTYEQRYKRRNKLQRKSIRCPSAIMALCGVHIGMIIYNDVRLESWTVDLSGSSVSLIIGIFYVSSIFGMWLGSVIIGKIPMKTLYVWMIVGTFPTLALIYPSGSVWLTILIKIGLGTSYGLAYISIIVYGSEIVESYYRGRLLSLQHILFFIGIFIESFISDDSLNNIVSGVEVYLFIMSLICIVWLNFAWKCNVHYESIVKMFEKEDRDSRAVGTANFMSLRQVSMERYIPRTVRSEWIDLRHLVFEDKDSSRNIFKGGNYWPLILVFLLRLGFFSTFNYALNKAFIEMAQDSFSSENTAKSIYIGIRCVSLCFVPFSIDKRRRIHGYLPLGLSGAILFVVAGLLWQENYSSDLAVAFVIIFQFTSGLGAGVTADVYASEAFNTKNKAFSVIALMSIDFLIHVLTIFVTIDRQFTKSIIIWLLIGHGIGLLIIAGVLYIYLPETSNLTLLKAKNKFVKKNI